jgi:hypothetical protein
MSSSDQLQGRSEKGNAPSQTANADPFTEEELSAVDGEPVPGREAMSTLLWAPGPASIAPVEEFIGDEGV